MVCFLECEDGYYGHGCMKPCMCGSRRCHPETGVCLCPPGLKGPNCLMSMLLVPFQFVNLQLLWKNTFPVIDLFLS